jgi:putative transposase
MDYRKGSHTVYHLEYHLGWVTKYRYHVLTGEVQLRVRELIRQICQQHEVTILKGPVSKDPIHLLISAPPHHAVSDLVQKLKGRSSRELPQEFPHLRKRYWGQHIWVRGYFGATVGQVTDEMIRDDIEHHMSESPDEKFTVDPDSFSPLQRMCAWTLVSSLAFQAAIRNLPPSGDSGLVKINARVNNNEYFLGKMRLLHNFYEEIVYGNVFSFLLFGL